MSKSGQNVVSYKTLTSDTVFTEIFLMNTSIPQKSLGKSLGPILSCVLLPMTLHYGHTHQPHSVRNENGCGALRYTHMAVLRSTSQSYDKETVVDNANVIQKHLLNRRYITPVMMSYGY